MSILYKIEKQTMWQKAVKAGVYLGSSLDLKDGFIHLSTAAQAAETARLHFSGQTDLILIAMPELALKEHLKWEPSRGGQLFPHVYSTIDPDAALWAKPLPWTGAAHEFPKEFFL